MTTINQVTQYVALAFLVSVAAACDEDDKTGGGKQNTSEDMASATSGNPASNQGDKKEDEQSSDATDAEGDAASATDLARTSGLSVN